MIGSTVSHYQILEELGRGGMGEVYKAYDTQLNRFVALKFLPRELANDAREQERLRLEALAASSLIHPNIIVIFEISEHHGRPFLAMEYVEAGTLKKIIEEQSSTLTIAKVVDITSQICDGLSAAHDAGVIHRDIKSANILLTPKGHVKIMDFGLALHSGGTNAAKRSSTVGALSYMSPEQARGETADVRSDIFSLGIVLYELLARRLPFVADHADALAEAISRQEPPPLNLTNPEVTASLQRIVSRAMAKNPADRYQHIGELLADLSEERTRGKSVRPNEDSLSHAPGQVEPRTRQRRNAIITVWGGTAGLLLLLTYLIVFHSPFTDNNQNRAPVDQKSLAILPFVNLGENPEDEYFSDGITEDLLTHISKLQGLRVASRTTVMHFKGSSQSLAEIGKSLRVGFVLQGSVRTIENHIRVVTQLIEVTTESRIWSKTYEKNLNDVLALQSELARELAEALRVELSTSEEHALLSKPTNNLDAYRLFLQARHEWRQRTSEGLRRATSYLQQAILLDSAFALAYVGLADCYSLYPFYSISTPPRREAYDAAEQHALKALSLNPHLAEAHASLGNVLKESRWDWEGAANEFRKAIELNPRYATAHQWFSECLRSQGKMEEAIAEGKIAFELEPFSPIIGNIYGAAILYHHRYDESIPVFRKVLDLDPNAPYARINLGWACRFLNFSEEAATQFELAGIPRDLIAWLTECQMDSTARRSRELTATHLTGKEREYLIMGFALCGEQQKALDLLEQLMMERWPNIQFLIRHPALKSLQSEDRFIALVRSMGLSS